jgi:hypothetical protein
MKKRQKFKCWSCHRTFSLFLEITKEQTLTEFCPFCAAECVVDLDPLRKQVVPITRGEKGIASDEEQKRPRNDMGNDMVEELTLPEVLQTQQK